MLASFTLAAFLGAWMRHRTAAAVTCQICTLAAAIMNAYSLRPRYLPPALAINRPVPAGAYFLNSYLRGTDGRPLSRAAANRAWRAFDHTHGWADVGQALARVHAASIQVYVPSDGSGHTRPSRRPACSASPCCSQPPRS